MVHDKKFNKLKENLKKMERVIIAYSGGVDSTLLLKAASMSGLNDILAVTSSSESVPKKELEFAKELTLSLNVTHRIIETDELKDTNYSSNPPERCYYCKKELFGRLSEIAEEENYPFILDGTNADDINDWRPGRKAAKEMHVVSPLLEAGLCKEEIRAISKDLGLPTWNRPSNPCLSSRFPYGQKITAGALRRVDLAEDFIRKLGVRELRVRDHSDLARIEVPYDDFSLMLKEGIREQIVTYLKSLGYRHVTLDIRGFRSGSSNELLTENSTDE
jgi:uncharacterized protein